MKGWNQEEVDKMLREEDKQFYNNPDKYLSVDEVGDLHLQWFFDRYAALRLLQFLPIFDRAYQLLTDRKHFSRRTAFGEMHGDCYLWIERCDHSQVLIYETQSNRVAYIKNALKFHIRELYYKYTYPAYRKKELQNVTLAKYKKNDFQDKYIEGNEGLRFGDARDEGYLGSMCHFTGRWKKVEHANSIILFWITCMKFWEPYLDDPTLLECAPPSP